MSADRYSTFQRATAGQLRMPPVTTTGSSRLAKRSSNSLRVRPETRAISPSIFTTASRDEPKRHARALGRSAVGIRPVADHEAARRIDAEGARRAQHAARVRLQTLRAVRLARSDDHVEQRVRAERLELTARRVIADERRAAAHGSEALDLLEQRPAPKQR